MINWIEASKESASFASEQIAKAKHCAASGNVSGAQASADLAALFLRLAFREDRQSLKGQAHV